MLSIAVSDVLFLVLQPNRQDFQGTAVTAEVARQLGVPELRLVVNKYAPWLDRDALCRQAEATLWRAGRGDVRPLGRDAGATERRGVRAAVSGARVQPGSGADGAGAPRRELRAQSA